MARTKLSARMLLGTGRPSGVSKPTPPKAGPGRKTAETGAGKTQKARSSGGQWAVLKKSEYPRDGFHSYCPGRAEVHSVHRTLRAANEAAGEVFYKKNPWGLGKDEIEDNHEVDEYMDGAGCLHLSMCPPDSEMWSVDVQRVGDQQ